MISDGSPKEKHGFFNDFIGATHGKSLNFNDFDAFEQNARRTGVNASHTEYNAQRGPPIAISNSRQ